MINVVPDQEAKTESSNSQADSLPGRRPEGKLGYTQWIRNGRSGLLKTTHDLSFGVLEFI